MEQPAIINIATINDGALIEAFSLELTKVLQNVRDMSTQATAKRSITLKVDFKPDDERVKINTEISVKTSLAPIEKHESQIFIAATEEGELVALDNDPRQLPLFTPSKPKAADTPIIQFASGKK